MISWVADPQESDLFQTLFGTSYRDVETPIATDNLVITKLMTKSLYDGLYKFEMSVMGSVEPITSMVSNDITTLSFTVPKIKERQLFGLQSLLKVLLYKHYGYHTHMTYADGVITPIINGDLLYVKSTRAAEINQVLPIENMIGWEPLLDLTPAKTSIEVKSSDLINLFDLSKYHSILGVPVVVVDGDDELQARAKRSEFQFDMVGVIATQLYDLIQHSFSIDNTPVVRQIVNQYDYKILKETEDTLYLQHLHLDKQFILNNMKRVASGRVALAILIGDWCWNYTSNFQTFVQLMYAVIRSVHLLKLDVQDVQIRPDLSVIVPISSVSDIDEHRKNTTQFMKDKLYVEKLRSEKDATGYTQGIPIKVFNQWVIVDTQQLTTTN